MRLLLAALPLALAATPPSARAGQPRSGFTEDRKNSNQNSYLQGARRAAAEAEAKQVDVGVIESARQTYEKYNNRVRVPGFISASPLPQVGRIVGPVSAATNFRMGDRVYIRWSGAPLPRAGDRYSTFTPAVVLQNLAQPTDFEVYNMPSPTDKLPAERRLAGYFYETSGRLRVLKVQGGLVHALVEQLSAQLKVGDELMQVLPFLENITPINSGIQLSAAVVSGSPPSRLSTTKRSYLYLNRGSRDGIRVGRVFESIEHVRLDESVGGAAPELSNGEAIVVHVTDSYSTAMITRQFDVIRIGSLLRTKQEENQTARNAPMYGFNDEMSYTKDKASGEAPPPLSRGLPEVPSADKLPGAKDESLPEPRKRPSPTPLTELDELERTMKMKDLSPTEKSRLDKLSRQERIGRPDDEDLAENPGTPTVENSFKDGKKTAKKDQKKKAKKSKNDEEELNLLMMQN